LSALPITLALSLTLGAVIETEALAQEVSERVYLNYHGHISDPPSELEFVSCTFRFTLSENGEERYVESDSLIPVLNGAFSTTLGDSPQGPFPEGLFNAPTSLSVECDITGDGLPDLSVTEDVAQTPISMRALSAATAERVDGEVNATSLSVGGAPIVSPTGEWLGAPITPTYEGAPLIDEQGRWVGGVSAGEVSATRVEVNDLEVSTHAQLESLSTPSASADVLYLTELYHLAPSAPEGSEASALISTEGAWVGPLRAYDSDGDGFSDAQELALGTSPIDSASAPLDENNNLTPDLYEQGAQAPLEGVISGLFTEEGEVSVTSPINGTSPGISPWAASSLSFEDENISEDSLIETLSVSFNATYLDAVTQAPISADDLVIQLFHTTTNTFFSLHNQELTIQGTYSEQAPPVAGWTVQGEPLAGLWQLIIEQPNTTRGVLNITDFQISATYRTPSEVAVQRNLNMRHQHQLLHLPTPTEPGHAVSKAYLDERLAALEGGTTSSNLTARVRLFETYDEALNSYSFGDEASLFGGVAPSVWASQGVFAESLTPSNLDALLTEVRTLNPTTLLAQTRLPYADATTNPTLAAQQAAFFVMHFEVENTTAQEISWPVSFLTTCNSDAAQHSSLALNQTRVWPTADDLATLNCNSLATVNVTLALPAEQVSNVVMVVANSPSNAGLKSLSAALINNSFALPQGVQPSASWR
jgi:hypothetical protein